MHVVRTFGFSLAMLSAFVGLGGRTSVSPENCVPDLNHCTTLTSLPIYGLSSKPDLMRATPLGAGMINVNCCYSREEAPKEEATLASNSRALLK
jgi:hypothetical protein